MYFQFFLLKKIGGGGQTLVWNFPHFFWRVPLYILLSYSWGGSSVHSTFNVPTKLNIIEDLLTSKNIQTRSDVTKIN